jgi:2'-hydroxyisoflavone reductase
MKILIIGGTIFLGRQIVEQALELGHEITLFNRGIHNPDIFPQVEKIRGDRNGDLSALRGREWDAVIDPSGQFPRSVRTMAETLADSVGHYTFISSLSVYSDPSKPGGDESAPVAKLADESVEEITHETYGGLKALCEQAAEEVMPGRAFNVRAGLIVGPHDLSDRFTYWPHRIAQGGEVLAPEGPELPVQFIDVRDLAAWIIHMVETSGAGTFNATGKGGAVTMGDVIDASLRASGADARITWVEGKFLLEQNVGPWMELPLWLPSHEPEFAGFNFFDISKALAAGLTFRSVDDTVQTTLAWDSTLPLDRPLRAGLAREREAELLAMWKEQEEMLKG